MSKEAINSVDKRVIKRLTFNSYEDLIKQGCIVTDITFKNGRGIFANNGSSRVVIPKEIMGIRQLNAMTVRIKVRNLIINTYRYLFCMENTEWCRLDGNKELDLHYNTNLIYVDDESGGTTPNPKTDMDVVFSLDNFYFSDIHIGAYITGDANTIDGEIELVEIYDGELTANEIKLLYENKLYRKPIFENTVLHINPLKGVIDDIYGNTITNYNVPLKKLAGRNTVMKFNDTTQARIDCGNASKLTFSNDDGDLPFSFLVWIRLDKIENNTGRDEKVFAKYTFTPSNKLEYWLDIQDGYRFWFIIRDNVTTGYHYIEHNFLSTRKNKEWFVVGGSYDGSATVAGMKLYINGSYVATSSTSLGTYVQMHQTDQSVILGHLDGVDATGRYELDGQIGEFQLIQQELTAEDMINYYYATKNDYIG